MTDTEAIRIAEEEIKQISYMLETNPQIYDNPGMRKIYQRKHELFVRLLRMAKKPWGKYPFALPKIPE